MSLSQATLGITHIFYLADHRLTTGLGCNLRLRSYATAYGVALAVED
jgi:hypothetical protein